MAQNKIYKGIMNSNISKGSTGKKKERRFYMYFSIRETNSTQFVATPNQLVSC